MSPLLLSGLLFPVLLVGLSGCQAFDDPLLVPSSTSDVGNSDDIRDLEDEEEVVDVAADASDTESDEPEPICATDDECGGDTPICGPDGCQSGQEGEPCDDSSDCGDGAPVCLPTSWDPLEVFEESACGQASELGEPCLGNEQCVSPLRCSPGLPGACQEGIEGDDCDDDSQCSEAAPTCARGACHDGSPDDPCVVGSCQSGSCQDDGRCHEPGFVYVNHTTFRMGCPAEEGESEPCLPSTSDTRAHDVTLTRSFLIQVQEVDRGAWFSRFDNNPGEGGDEGEPDCEDCPVTAINWYEALAYANSRSEITERELCYTLNDCTGTPGDLGTPYVCESVIFAGLDCTGYRLPTEAEWERAASSGNDQAFESGDYDEDEGEENSCETPPGHLLTRAWFCANATNIHEVGEQLPSEWGLYDMAGNVFEWTYDAFAPYGTSDATDPLGASGDSGGRVYRGGAFFSLPVELQIGSRFAVAPEERSTARGLRLVRTALE